MKEQFPLFAHHPEIVYLDNAASVQKPQYVLDEVYHFHTHEYANIHRGSYPLALAAEHQRDRARYVIADALGGVSEEIIFTHNATHSSNILAYSCLYSGVITQGDIIVVGLFDHHANIVPRQSVAQRAGATLMYVGFDTTTRQYDRSIFDTIDRNRLKIVSLSLVSNVTGQVLSLDFVKKLSKECQIYFVVDASQAVPHLHIDVSTLGADFLYFTGHKCGAMTGIGVLRGKKELLNRLQPVFLGGGAIDRVTIRGHTYQPAPDKFEPGTPHVAGAVSLRAAFERRASLHTGNGGFRENLVASYTTYAQQEIDLVRYACEQFAVLQDTGFLTMIGNLLPDDRLGIFSWTLTTGSVHKLGLFLGDQGICIRTGAHCTHPLHYELGIESSARMSIWLYNDIRDLSIFFAALRTFVETEKSIHSS